MGSGRTGVVDQASLLARELGMSVHYQPVRRVRIGGWSSLAVLMRTPARAVRGDLPPALQVSRRIVPRGALWVETDVDGTEVQVVASHLSLTGRERRRQASAPLGPDWLGSLDHDVRRIVLGNLNAVPHSAAYRTLGRAMGDAQRLVPTGRRPRLIFPARLPTLRLDHVFVGPDTLKVVDVQVPRTLLTCVASGHLRLLVNFKIVPNGAAAEVSGPSRPRR